MKRILIIILFLLSVSAFAESDFRFYSFGEFSYYPMLTDSVSMPYGIYFGTNIGIGIEWKSLYVEVNQNVFMTKGASFTFAPFKEEYFVRAGFSFWAIGISYEHLCTHGVDNLRNYGGYDKISINFDTRRLKK